MTLESTIPELLFQHIAAIDNETPVAYPNVPFEPPEGTYLEVRYLPNTNRNFLIGAMTRHNI